MTQRGRTVLGGFVDDGGESVGVADGQVGKHFAIKLDSGFGEATHQARIGRAILPGGGINPAAV